MSGPQKLDHSQKHVLKLISRDADGEGWCPVSAMVLPTLKNFPKELVEIENVGQAGRGKARLTQTGNHVVEAMVWL